MPRNPRQRRRFQVSKKQYRNNRILLACVLFLSGVLLISLSFNLSGHKNDESLESASNEEEIAANTEEEAPSPSEEVMDPEMYAALNDDGSDNKEVNSDDVSFTLTALGDIACNNSLFNDAFDKGSNYADFSYLFENVKFHTQTSDIVVGNLETVFDGGNSSPDGLAKSLKDIGVDVVCTANEHCLDAGLQGLDRTIDVLNDADVSHIGTYKSQEDRDSVLIKYTKGVKVAFLNYTFGTNAKVSDDSGFCVNVVNNDLIASDIAKAKEQKPDVIVAYMHWGKEYEASANASQTELADFLFQNGVDVIFGSHPHVLQSMEKRSVTLPDGSQKDGFVVYSLGNFVGDEKNSNANNSAILNVKLTKHLNGSVSIDSANYVPINCFKDNSASWHKFKILDVERNLAAYDAGDLSLGAKNYEFLKKQLESIQNAIGKEF